MVIFKKEIINTIPSTGPGPGSRVKRLPDDSLAFTPFGLSKTIDRKYFKNGKLTNSVGLITTPSGKMFAFPSQLASSIEIEDLGAASGKILETRFLEFMSEIGVPRRDIFNSKGIPPSAGNREEEFSDGVILFGDTAFLLQMKNRNSKDSETYISTDEYKHVRRVIQEGKIQYYRSLDLAKKSGNKVEMDSISGETREIDIEKYNWVSIVIINRNYFATDKPVTMTSDMNSPKYPEIARVNHVIVTLQGIVNLFNLFGDHYGLLSYFKMLSMEPRQYRLCEEPSLAYDVYGTCYGLEDNSLRFIRLMTKAVNHFFNENIISKDQSSAILEPIYSHSKQALEELFVNVENNFTPEVGPLFAWEDTKSNFIILLDYAGRISAIAHKETYLKKHENYRADEFAEIYDPLGNRNYPDKDTHLSISDVDSFSELKEISIAINQNTIDKRNSVKDILALFKLGQGNLIAPQVLNIIEEEDAPLQIKEIVVMGDIIFVPQVVEAHDTYLNSLFSESSDLLTLQAASFDCSEAFARMVNQAGESGILKAKNDTGEKVDVPLSKYHLVSLLVVDGEFFDDNLKNELYFSSEISENSSTVIILMDGLKDVIFSLKRNGVVYDFFRRISIRNKIGDISPENTVLTDYINIIGNMEETKDFIVNFNSSVLARFDDGRFDKNTVRRIFSIFDSLDNLGLSNSFREINKQIKRSLRIADRFTFAFRNPYVFVFFTVCNGLTTQEKKLTKLVQELISKSEVQNDEFIVGILSDIVQNRNNGKHAMVVKLNPKIQ